MSSFQRVIKYVAIAFAVLLAVGIISGIASAAINIISAVTGKSFFGYNEKRIDFSSDFIGVESLDISNSAGNMYIVVGDTFRVEAENVLDSFQAEVTGNGTLTVSEDDKAFQWFNFLNFGNHKSKITVYLPEDFVADKAYINTGAGDLQIDKLNSEDLAINAGAGNVRGNNMTAERTKIDGGVGNITLSGVSFTEANLQCGVGSMKLDGELQGDNKLDCGIGDIDLELKGDREDYDIDIDSGIGTIRVDGKKVSELDQDNDAMNSIKVNGGIGKVNIDFR
jgi:DUF4097 and DUF4098 domain-containing protein YvlB